MCEFSFNHTKTPEEIYERAKSAIIGNGGKMNGDVRVGTFSIEKMGMAVEGRYEITMEVVKLSVDKKPFFISCDQIENLIGPQLS